MNRILIGAERLMWKEVGLLRRLLCLYGGKKSARCRIFCIIFRFHYFYAASSFSAPRSFDVFMLHLCCTSNIIFVSGSVCMQPASHKKQNAALSSLSLTAYTHMHSLSAAEHCNLLNVYILWEIYMWCLPVCKNGRFLRLRCTSLSTNLMCKSSPNGAPGSIYFGA